MIAPLRWIALDGGMTSEPKINVTLRMKPSTAQMLGEMAELDGRNRADYIRLLIAEALEKRPLSRDAAERARVLSSTKHLRP